MDIQISSLAPARFPELPAIDGVRMATVAAGIKYADRDDVWLMLFDTPAAVAGVFTRSQCPSAPVEWCKKHILGGKAQALLVNSGNANAFTGVRGTEAVAMSAQFVSKAVGCPLEEVLLASTGVIGEPLDAGKFASIIPSLVQDAKADNWQASARAIMTTDTFAKLSTASFIIDGRSYHLNGIAKGSGMIAPDMATMLSFLVTDAPIAANVLQQALSQAVKESFNAITVDSDTSTSDCVLLFSAHGSENTEVITATTDRRLRSFKKALRTVMLDLAQLIVRDGEGASKFVEIHVKGARSGSSAKRIGFAIANSPLVKTAIAGEDANWGRIVMAVGKAGEPADRDKLAIWFGDIRVAHKGERDADYREEEVARVMREQCIKITVDIGLGRGRACVYTCDLTKHYVAINGDYRS